jgi:ABC-2 type transport system permease protein
MDKLVALTSRELKAFWYSPIAYVVGALFLLLQGSIFTLLIAALNDPSADPSVTIAQTFFGPTFFYCTAVLITVPFLTMRAFSEEKRTGTIEFLLTAPVSDAQVVLAKFLGAWLAYCMLWALTAVFFLLLQRTAPFDWAPVLTGYLGTWLLGGALIAVGLLASSLTRNQAIAAFLCFVILLLLFCVGILDFFVRDPETRKLIAHASLLNHLTDFARGIVDTRPLIYYLSVGGLALFLTGRVIGHPRWRS